MTELLNTAVFSLSMGENNIPSTEMDPENVVSRSILHGYFSPLVFWYGNIYVHQQRIWSIFCRVSS